MTPADVPWPTTIFTGEVFGGQCAYCNVKLSARALSGNLFQEHAGHVPSLALWIRVLSPDEFRGLELQLRAEFFVGLRRPVLDVPLQMPIIVLRFLCTHCLAEKSPITTADVLAFRTRHSEHIQ